MTSYTTDESLYKVVVKNASDRLGLELKLGQNILSEEQIKALSRAQLVAHICALRKRAGLEPAVKGLVENFYVEDAKIFVREEAVAEPSPPTTPIVKHPPVGAVTPPDPMAMFLAMIQTMEVQKGRTKKKD